jgi:DNA primase
VARAEHEALAAVLQFPQLVPAGFDELGGDVFQVPELRAVHDAIRAAGGVSAAADSASTWVGQVRELAAPPVAGVVTALAVEALPLREGGEADYVKGVVTGLLQLGITRRLGELQSQLGRFDAARDQAGREATFKEIDELLRRRDELRPD